MAKTKLKDLEVTEVSLVDAGANQHAHVALYKRNGGKPEEQQRARIRNRHQQKAACTSSFLPLARR